MFYEVSGYVWVNVGHMPRRCRNDVKGRNRVVSLSSSYWHVDATGRECRPRSIAFPYAFRVTNDVRHVERLTTTLPYLEYISFREVLQILFGRFMVL